MEQNVCNDKPMRGVWGHVLWDTMRRNALAFLGYGCFCTFMSVMATASHVFLGLICARNDVDSTQQKSQRLVAMLPLSRNTRGRLLWAQRVVLVQALFFLGVVLVQSITGADEVHETRWGPFLIGIFALAVILPALRIVMDKWSFVPALGVLAFYMWSNRTDVFPAEAIPFLGVACAAVLAGVAFLRAPYSSLLMHEKKRHRFDWSDYLPEMGPLFQGLDPVKRLVFVITLRDAVLISIVFMLLPLILLPSDLMLRITSGLMGFIGFAAAGSRFMVQARMVRLLPLSTKGLARVMTNAGLMFSAYTLVPGSIFVALSSEASLVDLAGGLLMGISLGAVGLSLQFRSSSDPHLHNVYAVFALVCIGINGWYNFWALSLFLGPFCVYFGDCCLREALLDESAYQYREPGVPD